MKGATSSDGKMSGNVQLVESYDKHKKSRRQEGHMSGGDSGGVHDPGGHDEIKRVVQEHGPAHTHLITKGSRDGMEDDGSYHSSTTHEDGYEHEADHGSLEEAHEHGMHAHGESDDDDHAGALDRESHARSDERRHHERDRSGSRGSSVDFLPGE